MAAHSCRDRLLLALSLKGLALTTEGLALFTLNFEGSSEGRRSAQFRPCNRIRAELHYCSYITGPTQFSWDERKNQINIKKHGVSFEAASLVFDNPLHISRLDRVAQDELRWQTIGMVGGALLLVVAHTWEETITHETHIRIISARRTTRQEKRVYEEGA